MPFYVALAGKGTELKVCDRSRFSSPPSIFHPIAPRDGRALKCVIISTIGLFTVSDWIVNLSHHFGLYDEHRFS